MDIRTVAQKLQSLGVLFRFTHGSSGRLLWRDHPDKQWRELSRLDYRMLLQILGCRDATLLQAAMALLADGSHRLSSEYYKKRN